MAEHFDQAFLADEMAVRRAINCLVRNGVQFAAIPVEHLNPAIWKFSTSKQGLATLQENGIVLK
jgi:hypothetical protein